MKKIILLCLMPLVTSISYSQIGFGTNNPDPSAAVEIKDSARGFLMPRMNMVQRNNIQNPATGLMIYQTDSITGFWYYDGIAWNHINPLGGKRRIVISDTISNIDAQAKLAVEFGSNTEEIAIENCTNLTSIDLSMVTDLSIITIANNPILQSVNLSNLKICRGLFYILDCEILNNLNVSSLEKIVGHPAANAGLYIYRTGLSTINFPKLKWMLRGAHIFNNDNLLAISFPIAHTVYDLIVSENRQLVTVSCPMLQRLGAFRFFENRALSTVSFNSLSDIYLKQFASQLLGNQNLSLFTIGNLTSFQNPRLDIEGKLTSGNVNSIFHNLVGITPPITNKVISLMMLPPAPPTGQGIIDKETLIANGNIVFSD